MTHNLGKATYSLGLMVYDAAVLAAAFGLAYVIRRPLPIFTHVQPLAEYLPLFGLLLAFCLATFAQQGLYRDVRDLSMFEEYVKALKALAYALLLFLALTFFLKLYERSRVLMVLFWLLASGLVVLARYGFYSLLKRVRMRGGDSLCVSLVGSDKKNKAIRKVLEQYPQLGYRLEGEVVLPREKSKRSELWRQKMEQAILQPYRQGKVQGVIISESVKNYHYLLELSALLDDEGVPHRHVSEAFDLTGLKAPAGEDLSDALTHLDEGQISGGYRAAKRLLDEVGSALVLTLTLPLWLMVIAAIKLDSPGPVFFRQDRIGYLGKRFKIYKFRSMFSQAPAYATTPRGQGDPRVTRVGAFLRKTSLDELPQIINVIRGDMSLVGPRPEMPFIVDRYKAIYRCRFLVKPGLTGLWQVAGRDKPMEENIKYDLYYIKKQSLLLDVIILLRTVPAVIFGKGAW
jgi:exopolysaccharide biosynthesis polyprenyl glycosylphosphotransferase